MKKYKILYYNILNYSIDNLRFMNEYFDVSTLNDPAEDKIEILKTIDVILAPLGYFIGKDKIDNCKNLKVIGSNTTGHPHIDVDYASKVGIRVVTLKNHRDFLNKITPTAELTWGLIIALTRNIIFAYDSVIQGKWSRWPFGGKQMLSRMTLGVVGLGRLGKMVATYGICFGMQVYYYDPYINSVNLQIERLNSLEDLVRLSDIVTVHIPYEFKTKMIFNYRIFSNFKKGGFFINTSRGEIVNEEALIKHLESGHLAGAAVDVLSGEFETGFKRKLYKNTLVDYAKRNRNLIITPHIGGSTKDAWELTQKYALEQIIRTLEGC